MDSANNTCYITTRTKGTRKMKGVSQKPKAKSQKPKAKSQKPKAKSQKPKGSNPDIEKFLRIPG